VESNQCGHTERPDNEDCRKAPLGVQPQTVYCASGGDAPWDCLGCVYLPGCPTQPCGQVGGIMQCSDRASLQCINGSKQRLIGAVLLRL
jgi:hypothetical protein